jgi:hypothetical protein
MKNQHFLGLLLLIITACSAPQQIAPSKYNPQFNYTPEKREQISDNSLTIAIIDPVFSDGEANQLVEPYSSFVGNMADDVEETLNGSGFKIKGPYKTRDEMVYGDKLNSDFALEIEVEILTEQGDFGKKSTDFSTKILCNTCYKVGGTFYHKGRIIVTATDPIDGEKFWKKTIDLDRRAISANGVSTYDSSKGQLTTAALMQDVGVYNPVAKALEAYYKDAMSSISRQIDPREMQQISKQIKAKRKRVGQ